MPVPDIRFVVGRVLGSLRRLEPGKTIIPVFDISLAYFHPETREGLLLHTLVRDEEHVHLIKRVDRLYCHIVGISGADADDENFSHRVTSVTVSTLDKLASITGPEKLD